jgi:tetraacyldisaccharide 4'-kinase
LTALLAPLSLPYRLGLLADRFIKSRSAVRLPRFTISVGNLTWGGTGKTPLVIKLLSDLKNWGHKPAVLTRGYGGEGVLSDEPALIADYHPDVPVAVGAQRATNAQRLLKAGGVYAFVLDDGFQHWRLKRDLDIVCIDATDP